MRKIDEIKNKMVSFTCHKTVKAVPMSLSEYSDIMGCKEPEEDAQGYFVMYEPDGHPNMEGFEGYVSWSPKDTFEKGYKLSETFTDRLKIEMEDLEVKLQKLENFLYSDKSDSLEETQKSLMKIQLCAMVTYYGIVSTRFDSLTLSEEN